jgi:WD40 repeat protein
VAQSESLEAFRRAIGREGHVLLERPGLVWQQLHNRLQWDETVPGLLASERGRRSMPGRSPWLQTRTPFHESTALIRFLVGHRGDVTACAVAPDGSFVLSASTDGTIRKWNPSTGEELGLFQGDGDEVYGCAVSPDGSRVVSAGHHNVTVWDAESGEELRKLQGRHPVAFAPDGSLLSDAGDDLLRLWDPRTGTELLRFEGDGSPVYGCAVSPDASFVVSARQNGTLKVWRVSRRPFSSGLRVKRGRTLRGHTGWVMDCAVSADGRRIVSGGDELKVWDADTGAELLTVAADVQACAFSPDGRFVVGASQLGGVRVWDSVTGEQLQVLEARGGRAVACTVSPDGSFVVSTDGGSRLVLSALTAAEPSQETEGPRQSVSACAASADGSFALSVSGTFGDEVRLWDLRTGRHIREVKGELIQIGACAASPDGSFVVSGKRSPEGASVGAILAPREVATAGALRVVEAETGTGTYAVSAHGCAVSADGSFVVSPYWEPGRVVSRYGADHLADLTDAELRAASPQVSGLILWDPHTGKRIRRLEHDGSRIRAPAVSPDQSFVLFADGATLRLWDPESGRELRAFTAYTTKVNACAMSPDASFVVSAGDEGTVSLWDTRDGRELQRFDRHAGPVHACAVSPDQSVLFSAGADGLRVWDAVGGSQLAAFPAGLRAVNCVALHPYLPLVFCAGESVYFLEVVGVEYGPIVVTPIDRGEGATLSCPKCWRVHSVEKAWRGSTIDCPTLSCDLRLRVNPFVVRTARTPHWRQLLSRRG